MDLLIGNLVVFSLFFLFGVVMGGIVHVKSTRWAIVWIIGFFLSGAVAFFPSLADIVKWPGTGWSWFHIFLGLIQIFFGIGYLKKSYRIKIPVDPVSAGIVTSWDEDTGEIKTRGRKFLPNWWPFNITVIVLESVRKNIDVSFSNVSTSRKGVTVSGKWAISFSSNLDDGKEAAKFLKNGKEKGVQDQVTDLIPKILLGVFGGMTWEDITQGKLETQKAVWKELIGREEDPTSEELSRGIKDAIGYGVKFHFFYLKEAAVNDRTMEQAGNIEAQKLAREARLEEIKGVAAQVKILTDTGMPEKDASDLVAIFAEEGVTKNIVDIRGLQQASNGTTTADQIDEQVRNLVQLLALAGVDVPPEKVEAIKKNLPLFIKSQGGVTGINPMNLFGVGGFFHTLGIELPKQEQKNNSQQKKQTNPNQATRTMTAAEEEMARAATMKTIK